MTQELNHDKKREATSSIRGYVYQAYQSVLAWMRLNEHEQLYLESAEDFDIHEVESVTTTQVKDTDGGRTLTLRSPDVVAAINNYWHHKQRNPDRTVRLRFLTTATQGKERGSPFGEEKGLDYWAYVSRDEKATITPLRNFLLELNLDGSLQEFLRSADDSVIRDTLILNICWDAGCRPKGALIAGIKDRLIFHGDRKGVDSYHSEKTLDTLLSRVANLLSFEGERRLTYADFCRAFDEATMEMMPRGEAAALRSMISQTASLDLNQIAKTSFLASLVGAPLILGKPLPLVRGATRRESLVANMVAVLQHHGAIMLRGSTGLGKTSLARLISDRIGGQWVWAGFRGLEPAQIADHLRRIAYEINAGSDKKSNLVLDDLDLGASARFEMELLSIVFYLVNNGQFVIITGPLPCSPGLLSKLWLPTECDKEVPYLDESEIAAIALNHGLNDKQKLTQWSRAVWLATGGHPQLVHARVRNLQSKNWPSLKELGWLDPKDLEKERAASRRRLIEDIPSEEARTLAYRLSMLIGQFTRQRAFELAQLPPPAARPGEALDTLVGPWVEMVADDAYRVSPLLQNEGSKVLSPHEAKSVHEAIALSILKQKSVSPSDVGSALMHAFLAKSESALIALTKGIMISEPEAWRAIGDSMFWFSEMALQPGQRLYENNLIVEIALRLAQFRIAAACKQEDQALAIIDRTIELIEQPTQAKLASLNAILAYSVFLNTYEVKIPPMRSVPMLSRLMDLSRSESKIDEIFNKFVPSIKADQPLAGLSAFQTLFSFESARVTGLDGLDELLSAMTALDAGNRSHLLDTWDYEDESMSIVDQLIGAAWLHDVKLNRLDVSKACIILKRAAEYGQTWQKKALTRAAYIAMAVIYDEYGQDADTALEVLRDAEHVVGANEPKIVNEHAKVLYRLNKLSDALLMFESILSGKGLTKVEKMFSCRLAGMAAARLGDWSRAERLFSMGASEDTQSAELHRMAVGLTADAAFARWKKGRIAEALTLYVEVLKALEVIPVDQNLKNRHLHAIVRHCMVWLDQSDQREADRNLAEPPPGACSNQEPHEGFKDLQIVDMSGAWGLLANIDTRRATRLGLSDLAKQRTGGADAANH